MTQPIPHPQGLLLPRQPDFSLPDILDCGQCFRFWAVEDPDAPSGSQTYEGVALGRYLRLRRDSDGNVLFYDTTLEEFERLWRRYFDLDTDYCAIKASLSRDPVLKEAAAWAPGIRILRQDGWEALCCFILSQNNNIARIKGIVDRFCQGFGSPIGTFGGQERFAFPTPQQLQGVTAEDLAPLRAGFRAKYLADAVAKVNAGQIRLEELPVLPIDDARQQLQQIHGVGPKVAECALLYGFGRMECFPLDVWMKRVMAQLLPQGLPDCAQDCAGIAQQYLFHYARTCPQAGLSPTGPQPASEEGKSSPRKGKKKKKSVLL